MKIVELLADKSGAVKKNGYWEFSIDDLYRFVSLVGMAENAYESMESQQSFSDVSKKSVCKKCESYFSKYACGENHGSGECDCPRCQGFCQCEDRA